MRYALAIIFFCSLSVTVQANPGAPVQTILSDGDTFVLHENGSITKNNQFIETVTGAKAIAVSRRNLYVLKNSGEIWCRDDFNGCWECVNKGSSTTWITADYKDLILLKSYGNVEIGTGGNEIYTGRDATAIWVEKGLLLLSTDKAIKYCIDTRRGYWVVDEQRTVEKNKKDRFSKLYGQ
jgi:hypothetical protein